MNPTEPDPIKVSNAIVLYKFISGTLELLLGLGIEFFGKKLFLIYDDFKAKELLENSHETLIHILETIVPVVIHHRVYIISLLIIIGIVKIIGAVGLLYKKEWGLDLLVVLFVIFLPFDVTSLMIRFTGAKLLYLVINLLIALYLMQFKPHIYIGRLKKYVRRKKS